MSASPGQFLESSQHPGGHNLTAVPPDSCHEQQCSWHDCAARQNHQVQGGSCLRYRRAWGVEAGLATGLLSAAPVQRVNAPSDLSILLAAAIHQGAQAEAVGVQLRDARSLCAVHALLSRLLSVSFPGHGEIKFNAFVPVQSIVCCQDGPTVLPLQGPCNSVALGLHAAVFQYRRLGDWQRQRSQRCCCCTSSLSLMRCWYVSG